MNLLGQGYGEGDFLTSMGRMVPSFESGGKVIAEIPNRSENAVIVRERDDGEGGKIMRLERIFKDGSEYTVAIDYKKKSPTSDWEMDYGWGWNNSAPENKYPIERHPDNPKAIYAVGQDIRYRVNGSKLTFDSPTQMSVAVLPMKTPGDNLKATYEYLKRETK